MKPRPARDASSARRNASGCSIGGSSAQSSITCSGQPWRALTASATRQRRREVVAAPDQRGGHGDPRELVRRDRRHPELAHQGCRARPSRSACAPGRGCRPRTAPSARPSAAQPVEVERALPPQAVVRLLGRIARGTLERGAERRASGSNGARPERVDEHQAADPVAVGGGEAGGDGAAERVADQQRRRRRRCARSARRARRARGPASSSPSSTVDAPWPGRSGAMTRWVSRGPAITRIQCAALPAGPCSRTTGGPSPPSSTAVETPAERHALAR